MNIMDLLQNDGHSMEKMANTYGEEYAGPCPFCGGEDRFRVWPEQGERGRYWCRKCGKNGDPIQFIRESKGMNYLEACRTVGIAPKFIWRGLKPKIEVAKPIWKPKNTASPGDLWQQKAKGFLKAAQGNLWTDTGAAAIAWLGERGLARQTIKHSGLGWNPEDMYLERNAWGLDPALNNDTGKPKKLWLPQGLVIPCFHDDRLVRIRIRRPAPTSGGRYIIIPGSVTRPMVWTGKGKAGVVVEAELDGFLVWQEAGDLVDVIAIGNAQARPDEDAHSLLSKVDTILVALDDDDAGAKEYWKWWVKTYPKAVRWPCPVGKDPGEAYQAGLDIRKWIEAGLAYLVQKRPGQRVPMPDKAEQEIKPQPGLHFNIGDMPPFPKNWLSSFDETVLERLAIMTIDGGLSDTEAIKALGR